MCMSARLMFRFHALGPCSGGGRLNSVRSAWTQSHVRQSVRVSGRAKRSPASFSTLPLRNIHSGPLAAASTSLARQLERRPLAVERGICVGKFTVGLGALVAVSARVVHTGTRQKGHSACSEHCNSTLGRAARSQEVPAAPLESRKWPRRPLSGLGCYVRLRGACSEDA